MARSMKDRRKALIVDQTVQKRIIAAVILVPTIGLAVSTTVVAVFCRRLLTEMLRADVELPSLVPLFLSVLAFFIVCSFVVAIQGLRFSHRIAGPAYRICRSIERARSGDIAFRLHLRKGDYLTEVASEFNRMLDWLNENPPSGVTRGSDVIEVHHHEDDEHVSAESEEEQSELSELYDSVP